MVKGKEKIAGTGFGKKIGVSEFTVLPMVCLDKEKLGELLNFPEINQPIYEKEDEDGKKQIVVTLYLKDINDDSVNPFQFTITKKDNFSEKTMKNQYINNIGATSWAKDDNDLKMLASNLNTNEGYRTAMQSFLKRPYRVAKPGEEQLYSFLLKLYNLDQRDPEAELSYDMKKFFNLNFKELEADLKQFSNHTITANYVINSKKVEEKVDESTGEVTPSSYKEYQGIWKDVLPGGWSDYFKKDHGKINDWVKGQIEKWGNNMRGEYGCKGYFITEPVRAYDSKENPLHNSETSLHTESASFGNSNTSGANGNIGKDDLPF